jgi:hypothetical protein
MQSRDEILGFLRALGSPPKPILYPLSLLPSASTAAATFVRPIAVSRSFSRQVSRSTSRLARSLQSRSRSRSPEILGLSGRSGYSTTLPSRKKARSRSPKSSSTHAKIESNDIKNLIERCKKIYESSRHYKETANNQILLRDQKQNIKEILNKDLNNIEFPVLNIAKLWATLANFNFTKAEIDEYKNQLLSFTKTRIKEFNMQDCVMFISSFAKLGLEKAELNSEFLNVFFDRIRQNILNCNSLDISLFLWACAFLDLPDILFKNRDLLDEIIQEKIYNFIDQYKTKRKQIDPGILGCFCQLRQAYNYYAWIFSKENKKFIDETLTSNNNTKSSALHMKVVGLLKHWTSEEFDIEVYTESGRVSDVVFKNKKIIIEVNGHCHYNDNGELNAKSNFHNRMDKKNGYIIIEVSYALFDEDSSKRAENFQRLQQQLKAAGIVLDLLKERSVAPVKPNASAPSASSSSGFFSGSARYALPSLYVSATNVTVNIIASPPLPTAATTAAAAAPPPSSPRFFPSDAAVKSPASNPALHTVRTFGSSVQ